MIGVIFATMREAGPFLRGLGAEPEPNKDIRVFSGFLPGEGEKRVQVCISGMGPEAAALAAREFLCQYPVQALVNAGVCGALGDGDTFEPGKLFTVSQATREPCGPESGEAVYRLSPGPWADLPAARLVTVSTPVFEEDRRSRLAVLGELVDMEGAGVAEAAAGHGCPCWMLKGVTDTAGNNDRERLHQNLEQVSRQIARLLVTGLRQAIRPVPPRPSRLSGEQDDE